MGERRPPPTPRSPPPRFHPAPPSLCLPRPGRNRPPRPKADRSLLCLPLLDSPSIVPPVTPNEILEALCDATTPYPRQAMEAAIAQREVMTPLLLAAIEPAAADPVAAGEIEERSPLLPLFLLAQFRETRAFRPLIRMVSGPGDSAFELLGDYVGEDLGRLLASVYDGDPAPLAGMIQDPQVDSFVRTAGIDALRALHFNGLLPRETLCELLRQAFLARVEDDQGFHWDSWFNAVIQTPLPELEAQARVLCEEDRLDSPLDNFEIQAELSRNSGAATGSENPREFQLVTDPIADTTRWESYEDRLGEDSDWIAALDEPVSGAPYVPPPKPLPYIAPLRVGRNDPCPCGSGRKYKKCCG